MNEKATICHLFIFSAHNHKFRLIPGILHLTAMKILSCYPPYWWKPRVIAKIAHVEVKMVFKTVLTRREGDLNNIFCFHKPTCFSAFCEKLFPGIFVCSDLDKILIRMQQSVVEMIQCRKM